MSALNSYEIMGAEMKPDVYETPHTPRFYAWAEGDMDGDYIENWDLAAKDFHPGTKIIVLEPGCPECHQIATVCRDDDGCEFDWDEWVENEFS